MKKKFIGMTVLLSLISLTSFASNSTDPFRPELFKGKYSVDAAHSDSEYIPQTQNAGAPEDQYFVFNSGLFIQQTHPLQIHQAKLETFESTDSLKLI